MPKRRHSPAQAAPDPVAARINWLVEHAPEFADQVIDAPFVLNAPVVVVEVVEPAVSRPEDLHPRPLAELCVRLSPHTAPIRRTRR